jgi:hypothetical protein
MVGALITAIVDVLLNVAMDFISLFVAFVIVPILNAGIVAAIFFSIGGIAYLCRRLYYYLRPLPAAPPPIRNGTLEHRPVPPDHTAYVDCLGRAYRPEDFQHHHHLAPLASQPD